MALRPTNNANIDPPKWADFLTKVFIIIIIILSRIDFFVLGWLVAFCFRHEPA